MFNALFPQNPQFVGRQAVTFHNQRDFIFFRQHRYIFRNGKRVGLQEIGPRFTLKLKSVQKGTFDSKFGEFEFMLNVSYMCLPSSDYGGVHVFTITQTVQAGQSTDTEFA
ncbi:hypothetical protein SARC_02201 [Sphaeroforma arctica JP610]|uniref:Brix domain-containing protein n=1 Tax=Sphaeroforma arctica JP610 TaxID=667725 RepID=A0A0L0GBL5_9EUKA|nr:hypothetical protein SARC_02201 [Sphaeroforma arctica JP610]KNC85628.1 hypothetical protein SARC_02201 [Sphaeroforma arctica JP610]|eukprot:XP_014159530.1 hypothetical protein SARC_02201 [Sphaeroforma arctica JP610]